MSPAPRIDPERHGRRAWFWAWATLVVVVVLLFWSGCYGFMNPAAAPAPGAAPTDRPASEPVKPRTAP